MSVFKFSFFFFLMQKPAYDLRISDWISDVASSDLRAQQSPGEIRQGAVVAAPVRPDGIAVLAVPFGASRGEVAELVAVRAEIPGLGDQLHAGQYRVLAQRVEEHRTGVEAVAGAAEDRKSTRLNSSH